VASDRSGNLTSVLIDREMREGELSAIDLAARTGRSLDDVVEAYRLLGVAIDDPSERAFSGAEVRLMELAALAEATMPDGTSDEIMRTIGASMAIVAESAVSAFVGSVEDILEQGSPRARAEATTATGRLGLELGDLLGPLLRHHFWLATVRQRAAMVAAPDRRSSTVTVGFVDLVGFTATTASMTSDDLLAFMGRFHGRTFDIVTGAGGRVVKHIGDEIMFSTGEPAQACDIALRLVDEFDDTGSRPCGGVAHGTVLARHGDLYGPVVNLAARLADVAISGEVLADLAVADAVDDASLAFEPAGRRQLKGFTDPVAVASLTRA